MTKSKIIRGFRLASIIMSAFFLIAVLCLHFIPLRQIGSPRFLS